MKSITILSGKGGVGKSTLAASIAVLLGRNHRIVTVDCDVDAPNLALILGLNKEDFESFESIQTSEKAELLVRKCKSRKACVDTCRFSAVSWDHKENLPLFNDFLCVGCGACVVACPECAINLKKVKNAAIKVGKTEYGFYIVSGQLNIGESGSGKVVDAVKMRAIELAENVQAEFLVIDSAAGIGCPVIASVRGSDYVIVVTEPTPAAFWDLERALQVVNHFNIPHGIVINRWDINPDFNEKIKSYAKTNEIPILGKIPYDTRFVDALVNLKPAVIYESKFENLFLKILNKTVHNIELHKF